MKGGRLKQTTAQGRWFGEVENRSGAEAKEVRKLSRMVHTIDEQQDATETYPDMS